MLRAGLCTQARQDATVPSATLACQHRILPHSLTFISCTGRATDTVWGMSAIATSPRCPAFKRSNGVGDTDDSPLLDTERLADALRRTAQGDRTAFREVYALTSRKLFGICLSICIQHVVAEDILHDVYFTVWRRAASWDPCRGAAITWLATIARNRSIDWRRSQRMMPIMKLVDDWHDIVDPSPDAETSTISSDFGRQLRLSLGALEPSTREAIRKAFFGGLTYSELAQLYEVPLGTMKSRIRRGLAKLRTDLEQATIG